MVAPPGLAEGYNEDASGWAKCGRTVLSNVFVYLSLRLRSSLRFGKLIVLHSVLCSSKTLSSDWNGFGREDLLAVCPATGRRLVRTRPFLDGRRGGLVPHFRF